jgi:hypothetical protein
VAKAQYPDSEFRHGQFWALPTAFGSALPQPIEGQRSGNQIDAAIIFARLEFGLRFSD